MKDFLVKRKTKGYSSPLSNFVRNASSAEKKRVYKVVMERATERQMRVIRSARKHHPELI